MVKVKSKLKKDYCNCDKRWVEKYHLKEIYNFSYKDVSFVQGMNSMFLIMLFIMFIKLVLVGIETKLLTTWFELLVLFGMIIILFAVIPFYTKGFFAITNILVLGGGMIYLLFNDIRLMSFSIKLFFYFIFLYYMLKVFNFYWRKQNG